ncbi:MAG: cytochrome P450 [Gammaproteobacteria bacterium]|nr:cytochrome P450 [Gammaproteobacteria bacterium]
MKEMPHANISPREVLRGFKQDRLGFIQKLINQYGSVFSLSLKPHKAIIMMNPDMINHILSSHKDNYIKGTHVQGSSFHFLKAALGDSIFITDDKALWAKHRRIVMPHLQRSKYNEYAKAIISNGNEMITRWQNTQETRINISEAIPELTLRNLLNSIFNEKNFDFDTLLEFTYLMKANDRHKSFKTLITIFDKLVSDFILRRMNQLTSKDDLVNSFTEAYQNEQEQSIVFNLIRNELKGLLIAGHETIAGSIIWSCYLLAQDPEAQLKIKTEFDAISAQHRPTYDDIAKLTFTSTVFKESLRLYPPIYVISRVAVADDHCDGFIIPKDAIVMIPIFQLQRAEEYWDQPEKFKPERFSNVPFPEETYPAYMPFGVGQRACIGREYAAMEACLTLGMIFSTFQFSLPHDYQLALNAENSLWPKSPLQLIIQKKW